MEPGNEAMDTTVGSYNAHVATLLYLASGKHGNDENGNERTQWKLLEVCRLNRLR